jgi:diguanylate cyclase (GGDEF)-like protein
MPNNAIQSNTPSQFRTRMQGWVAACWALAMVLFLASECTLAAALRGSPPFVQFIPNIDAYPQNFALVQDDQGIVYVGNSQGVLEFDGERWRLIRLSNGEIVRSLGVARRAEGTRVYVGGYNEFGFLERDEFGVMQYRSLLQRFKKRLDGQEFADVWDVEITRKGIFFRALRHLFFVDHESRRTAFWYHEGRFGRGIEHRGRFYIQFRGEGFKVLQGKEFVLAPETGELKQLVGWLGELPDGGLIGVGVEDRWWRWNPEQGLLEDLDMPNELPGASAFHVGLMLADGSVALSSAEGTVYLVDPKRESVRRLVLEQGFISDLHPAQGGGFWASGDGSIYRVTWPSSWSLLGGQDGIGGVYSLRRLGERYVLATAAGVTLLNEAKPKSLSTELTYDLFEVRPGYALLAESHHLAAWDGAQRQILSDELIYPRRFLASRFKPGRILLGTEWGPRVLQSTDQGLSILPQASLDSAVSARWMVEQDAETLWFGSERHGLWSARLSDDGRVLEARVVPEPKALSTGQVQVFEHAGVMWASAGRTFFRFQEGRFVPDPMFNLLTSLREQESVQFAPANGTLYAYSWFRIFKLEQERWTLLPKPIGQRCVISNYEALANDRVAFLCANAVLVQEVGGSQTAAKSPKIRMRAVSLTLENGERTAVPFLRQASTEMPWGDHSITFQFALPDFQAGQDQLYQGRLLGYEKDFSEWHPADAYTYSRLSPGRYQMQVNAKDSEGRISSTEVFEIFVPTPWHRSLWLWAALIASGCGLLGFLVRALVLRREVRMAEERQRLEAVVRERTQSLAEANARLERMAMVDGLTGIANRYRLDQVLAELWSNSQASDEGFSVMLIDVDHFKRFNDTHGHLAGDRVLKEIAACIAQALEWPKSLFARFGGEEFTVVLPEADAEQALGIAERLRSAVARSLAGMSVSIGIACYGDTDSTIGALLERADAALYQAKSAGRNCVRLG